MSKYYLDYENFASRNKRIIRGYATDNLDPTTSLIVTQSDARRKFLRKLNLPTYTTLKGDIGSVMGALKLSNDRVVKNIKLGLGNKGHATWGERKAARKAKNEKDALRNHILNNAVVKD